MGYDVVLIDDDVSVREHWERRFLRAQKRLLTFDGERGLSAYPGRIALGAMFFVDQEIRFGADGTAIAQSLYNRGFENIYLCTSHPDSDFRNFPWIKGVVGKKPPDWILEDSFTAPLLEAERGEMLARMTAEELESYKVKMKHFMEVSYGMNSGAFAGPPLDGFNTPGVVMNAWERAITLGLSEDETKLRVDHAWRLAF